MKNLRREVPTVTIGIPAHNEQENISYILQSVLDQKQGNYKLEKIIVLCDACTDDTAKKARQVAEKYPLIRVLDDGKRKGKTGRLNELYQLNKSDLVFNIDADVILSGRGALEKLVAAFEEKDVVLVSGNNQPAKALTLIERFAIVDFLIWAKIANDYLGRDNPWNIAGALFGLKDYFAKSFKYPEKTYVCDTVFTFITAKKQKKFFRFVKDAAVVFRAPSNLHDYLLQSSRNLYGGVKSVADYYGDWVYKEYYIPRSYKIKGLLKSFISDPVFTTGAIGLALILRILPPKQYWNDSGKGWKSSASTKKAIPIQ